MLWMLYNHLWIVSTNYLPYQSDPIFTSDQDPIFTSNFWQGLFSQLNVGLMRSTAYHHQTEMVNKCLEQYLRRMTGDKPKEWTKWRPLVEWWYNTSYHLSTQLTPFEVVYGLPPPTYVTYIPSESSVAIVNQSLRDWDVMIRLFKANLYRPFILSPQHMSY